MDLYIFVSAFVLCEYQYVGGGNQLFSVLGLTLCFAVADTAAVLRHDHVGHHARGLQHRPLRFRLRRRSHGGESASVYRLCTGLETRFSLPYKRLFTALGTRFSIDAVPSPGEKAFPLYANPFFHLPSV